MLQKPRNAWGKGGEKERGDKPAVHLNTGGKKNLVTTAQQREDKGEKKEPPLWGTGKENTCLWGEGKTMHGREVSRSTNAQRGERRQEHHVTKERNASLTP